MKKFLIGTVFSLLAFLTTSSGYGRTDKIHCPEEDFVKACLSPVSNFNQMKELASSSGWKWREDPRFALNRRATLTINSKNSFSLNFVEFSDVTRAKCSLVIIPLPPDFATPTCTANLQGITHRMSSQTEHHTRELDAKHERSTWQIKDSNTLVRVEAVVKKDKGVYLLNSTKYIFK